MGETMAEHSVVCSVVSMVEYSGVVLVVRWVATSAELMDTSSATVQGIIRIV